MSPDQVIKHFGNQTKAAAEIGISVQSLYMWGRSKKSPQIPILTQHAICNITKGALKVDRLKK